MMLRAVDAYRLWAATYDSEANPLVALDRRTMSRLLGTVAPSRLVDVACGSGRWLLHFQRAGASVFGVDSCDAMLEQAAKHVSLRGRLLCGDAMHLPLRDGTADLCFCSLALGYFSDLYRSFSELARIAAPGGRVAVSEIHPQALAAGWTRSFKSASTRYEIGHYSYTLNDIYGAAKASGLRPVLRHSAFFGEPELPFFQQAGKEKLFAAVEAIPALFAALWERPC
jgi:ubiquinone/menaquinone biosynthesis C-methylase UbiE